MNSHIGRDGKEQKPVKQGGSETTSFGGIRMRNPLRICGMLLPPEELSGSIAERGEDGKLRRISQEMLDALAKKYGLDHIPDVYARKWVLDQLGGYAPYQKGAIVPPLSGSDLFEVEVLRKFIRELESQDNKPGPYERPLSPAEREFEREPDNCPGKAAWKAQRVVFDPATGRPHLARLRPDLTGQKSTDPALGAAPVHQDWAKHFNFSPDASTAPEEHKKRLQDAIDAYNPFHFHWPLSLPPGKSPKEVLKGFMEKWKARKMIDNDKSLSDPDKEQIAKAVEGRLGEVGQDGKTIGDILGEEVKKYLARTAEPTIQSKESKLDPEAALRVLARHAYAMSKFQRASEIGYISPAALLLENPEAPVLAALALIPKARLDERFFSYMMVRDLIRDLAKNTLHDSVRAAANELLGE